MEKKLIWFFLLVSLFVICSTDFLFNGIPAYSAFVYKFGRALNNLSFAYLASLLFYWIVVTIPQNRNRRNIYDDIFRTTGNIIGDCEAIISELVKHSQYDPPDKKDLSQNDFEIILARINPNNNSTSVLQINPLTYATWLQFLWFRKNRSLDFINTIFNFMIYLESDYVKLLAKVKECHYFKSLDLYNGIPVQSQNMIFIADAIFKYYVEVNNLKIFADKNLSKYSKGYTLSGLTYFS